VAWLEAFLKEFKGAVVMVTHDRSLLEALAEWASEGWDNLGRTVIVSYLFFDT
jgi:ATPase subunit of ABC transporter with duplicated ATPase domains